MPESESTCCGYRMGTYSNGFWLGRVLGFRTETGPCLTLRSSPLPTVAGTRRERRAPLT